MRLLLDNNLSPALGEVLRGAGWDVAHLADRGLQAATDSEVMALAVREDRVLVSRDSDFGMLLAGTRAAKPSFVFVRRSDLVTSQSIGELLLLEIPRFAENLDKGAVIVMTEDRIRVRPLPFWPL